MGVRGELFSTRIILPNRTYFFNVKENRLGDLYLNIVESKNRETGGFDRQSVILFADDLQEFLKGFDESLKVMEKAVREKRHGTPGREEKTYNKEKPYQEGKTYRREKPNHVERERGNFNGEKKGRTERDRNRQNPAGNKFSKNFKTDRGYGHKPEGGRREGRYDRSKNDGNKRDNGGYEGGKRVVVRHKKSDH